MHKIERVDTVLAGEKPDRPPLSLWYHFGLQHGSGEQFARVTLEFFRHYDFDFLKVMNDYFYPPPEGLETVKTAADLRRLQPLELEKTDWRHQFRALEILGEQLHREARFIDTVFDPWQSIRRSMAGETIQTLMKGAPEALLAALDVVADNLIAYCRKSQQLGSSGIFLSIAAGSEIVDRDAFLRFVKPPAMKVLSAVSDMGPMTTAHIHGEELFFEDCLDLPAPVFNWWDRGPNGPSLAAVKQKTDACVMGGIDQNLVARTSPGFLRDHVGEGLRLGGARRFFLANGCTIDSWVYPGSIRAIVDAARSAGESR